MVVGVNRRFAPQGRTGELATTVGDHLIHIHIELRATARHPHMERKHILVLTSEDFITGLDNQMKRLIRKATTLMVCDCRRFFNHSVGSDHLLRHQIPADTEIFKGTLGLSAPQFIGWNLNFTKTIRFFANSFCHSLCSKTSNYTIAQNNSLENFPFQS
jgi:hypothetical protein